MTELTQADFDALSTELELDIIHATEVSLEAAGLRQAADAIERLKAAGAGYINASSIVISASTGDEFRKLARALGNFKKTADDNYFNATRHFDGDITVQVFIARSKLCKRVLIRTEDVPEQRIAAVPEKIIPASTREVYGWECTPSVLDSSAVPALAIETVTADEDDGIPF